MQLPGAVDGVTIAAAPLGAPVTDRQQVGERPFQCPSGDR